VLREERQARAKLEADYKKGSQIRQAELETFQKLRESKLKKVQELEAKLNDEIAPSIDALQGQIRDLKQDYVKARVATMKDGVVSSPNGKELIPPVGEFWERSELEQFIIYSCQMAGEILHGDSAVDDTHTCVPLRMAGLDMALTWSDDNYDNMDEMKGEVEMTAEMVQLIFDNAVKGGALTWQTEGGKGGRNSINKNKNDRRRLDEIYNDDDYVGDYDRYDEYTDDDYTRDTVVNDDLDNVASEEPDVAGKEKEMIDELAAGSFFKTRNAFVDRAKIVTDEVSKILDAPVNDGEENEAENELMDDDAHDASFDPAGYSMVRNDLRRKQAAIQRGIQWAASAKLLFSFSNQSDENLRRLAFGTLYYGQLSAVHVWQILQSILPEFRSEEPPSTCGSPWASSCPPKAIERKGLSYPPAFVLDAAASFCEKEAVMSAGNEMQEVCAADEANVTTIPSTIPDGYYGYTAPTKRSEDDSLSTSLFAPILSLSVPTDEMKSLEGKKRDAENEKRELDKAVNDIWKEIGGKDGSEMGENGELHAMADKCYDVVAGKYTYEMCVFGRASQKEGGGGGTSLGNWKGMERNAETGQRVLIWDNGQKCWNGPKRSATVYVNCGAETKVLSADEPDTCRYVFEMESPIGCDSDYKARMGL
jgi:protein kinase C substrate 80K-H